MTAVLGVPAFLTLLAVRTQWEFPVHGVQAAGYASQVPIRTEPHGPERGTAFHYPRRQRPSSGDAVEAPISADTQIEVITVASIARI
jgi:hypothetical protein